MCVRMQLPCLPHASVKTIIPSSIHCHHEKATCTLVWQDRARQSQLWQAASPAMLLGMEYPCTRCMPQSRSRALLCSLPAAALLSSVQLAARRQVAPKGCHPMPLDRDCFSGDAGTSVPE